MMYNECENSSLRVHGEAVRRCLYEKELNLTDVQLIVKTAQLYMCRREGINVEN